MERKEARADGLAAAIAAYVSWGLLPLYWRLVSGVEPLQIMACRVVFALAFTWILLALRGKAAWPRVLASAAVLRAVVPAAVLIAVNWGIYIWAVNSGRAVDASLGYYLNPLVNVLLGVAFFRERLGKAQWAAFALAAAGGAFLVAAEGRVPWIALALAVSFGLYGLAKKKTELEPLEGLAAETLVIAPAAVAFLAFRSAAGAGAFAAGGATSALLAASGVVTALPLLWFARGARKLPLSLLGFIQFLSPTLQLIIAVLVFREPFPASKLAGFSLVWAALAVYTVSRFAQARAAAAEA